MLNPIIELEVPPSKLWVTMGRGVIGAFTAENSLRII